MKKAIIFILATIIVTIAGAQDTINKTDAQGRKQGYWIKLDTTGQKVYEGIFRDGHPAGTLRYYYRGGKLKAVSQFSSDGTRTNTVTYFTNGKKMSEGIYINEKKEGLWKFFSDYDESLVSEEYYKAGIKDGISKTYYAGDGLAELQIWKEGVKDGLWEQYYEEGKIKLRGTYRNNEKDGEFNTYYSTGKVLYTGRYTNGNASGIWIYYDEKGTVEKKETYKDGLLIDTWQLHPDTVPEKE